MKNLDSGDIFDYMLVSQDEANFDEGKISVTSPIGMMATAQVCAAIPNFLVQEWHWIDSPDLWPNWVKQGEIIENGFISPTDSPGLGVEMNEDGARKAQVPGTPWFEKV